MRILHITAPGATGGLERVVRGLVEALRERGHAVSLLASVGTDNGPHPFVDALQAGGVPLRLVRLRGRAWRAEVVAITTAIREFRPDVVHTHGFRSDVLGLVAARRTGKPVVSTVHGYTGGSWKVRLYERVQRRALRSFDAVVAVSHPLAEDLQRSGIAPDRLHVVRNALNPNPGMERCEARRALGLAEHAFVAGWIGRFSSEKGADVFVDALEHLNEVTAVMIGDGPERAALAASTADRIHFPGALNDADRYMPAFDVLVLSSRTEGTPMVLLEGMAAGVPIVATAVGGVPHMIDDDEAILVPSPDAVDLARAIERVRADPAAARTRAEIARRRFESEFDVGPWVVDYEEVYGAAISRSRA